MSKKEGNEVICFVCVCFVAFGMGWEAMALHQHLK